MSPPGSIDSLGSLEEQAYVCLFSLLIREKLQNVPEAQRRVTMSQSAPGEGVVMTVNFPANINFAGYVPTVSVIPWLA